MKLDMRIVGQFGDGDSQNEKSGTGPIWRHIEIDMQVFSLQSNLSKEAGEWMRCTEN